MKRFDRLMALAMAASLALPAPPAAAQGGAILSGALHDLDRNGKMDRLVLELANPERRSWTAADAAGYVLLYDDSPVGTTRAYVASEADADPVRVELALSEAGLPFDTSAALFALDAAGAPPLIDAAPPILLSSVPVPGDRNFYRGKELSLVFSEPMAPGSLAFVSAPDPGGWSANWSEDGRSVSLGHIFYHDKQTAEFRLTGARDIAGNALVPGAWPMTLSFSMTNQPDALPAPDAVFTLIQPSDLSSLAAGGRSLVSWWTNIAEVANIRLSASKDGGSTWTTLAIVPVSRGSWPWYPDAALAGSVRLRLEGLSASGGILALDAAAGLSVSAGAPEPPRVLLGPSVELLPDGSARAKMTLDRPVRNADLLCPGEAALPIALSGRGPYDAAAMLPKNASGCAFRLTDLFGAEMTAAIPAAAPAPEAPAGPSFLAHGDLIKAPEHAAVYWYLNGKRWVFPNETVFRSWHAGFDGVVEVSAADLASIPVGGNVRMRSGTWLIKIESDPKVYAVEPDGALRWVPSEAQAAALYGPAWNARVRDVDVSLFVDYTQGEPLANGEYPKGYVARTADGRLWLVDGGSRRELSEAGRAANGYDASLAASPDEAANAWTSLSIDATVTALDERLSSFRM